MQAGRLIVLVGVCCLWVSLGWCQDWPQWRGPERTDVSNETGLIHTWPANGPRQLWVSRAAGVGYSGPAIVGQRLFTMGGRDGKTYLICLNVDNGEELWSTVIGDTYTNAWGDGPRGTPTVDGHQVYALTGNGDLVCAAIDSGVIQWQKNFVSDYQGAIPKWGFCESVLIDGAKLICTPGGSQGAIIALNKSNGETLWRSADCTSDSEYSSIMPAELNGRRIYIQLFMSELVGVDGESGKNVWQIDWPGRVAVIPTPIVEGSKVYVTAGYGVGCMLVDFSSGDAEQVYYNTVMKNHHGGVILVGGRLYGHSDKTGWVCQDFLTGELIWRERQKLGKGASGYADGQLYCIDEESGTVVLIDASAEKWDERGRFELEPQTEIRKPMGRIWTHPVIVNGRLYLRDQELIHCYDVSARQAKRN